jgi:glucokinase
MAKLNLAVDLGGTRVRTAVYDLELHMLARDEESTVRDRGAEGVIEQIAGLGRRSLLRCGKQWRDVACVAVASPGPLDSKTGVVYSPPNMPGWGTVHLEAELEARFAVPVKVVNDANADALAEYHFGAGRGHRNLVYLTVSTGIGGGVIVEGKLLEGSSGTAGEIGHTTIDRHGPICQCGNVGCLEMISSGTSIARRFSEALAAGERSSLTESPEGGPPTAHDIAIVAGRGDPLALAIFTDAAEALGFGVVNCIHIFNPDVVAIGGGVTKAGALLFDPIDRVVERYALAVPRRAVRVVRAELADDVGLIGAAAVARDEAAALQLL